MTEEKRQWAHDELKGMLRLSTIADLEKLIANPSVTYRRERANDYTINALRALAQSAVLPDDIRLLVVRILELHEKATDPFLGMNLSTEPESETQA